MLLKVFSNAFAVCRRKSGLNAMFNNDFAYSVVNVLSEFQSDLGNSKLGAGSGFLFDCVGDSKSLQLVTAGHMVDPKQAPLPSNHGEWSLHSVRVHGWTRHISNFGKDRTRANHVEYELYMSPKEFGHSPHHDLSASVPIPTKDFFNRCPMLYGVPIVYERLGINETPLAHAEHLKTAPISFGDSLHVLGYPSLADGGRETFVPNRPVSVDGSVATDPRYRDGPEQMINIFSYAGMSGGLILLKQVGIKVGQGLSGGEYRPPMAFGMVAKHVFAGDSRGNEYHHSGLSFMVPIDAVVTFCLSFNRLSEKDHSANQNPA